MLLVGHAVQAVDAPQPVVSSQPNVLWIVLDALRAQNLSCYGYDRETTPNLDELAARGVLCEHHLTQGMETTESVPSYMTGRYFPAQCIGFFGWERLMMDPAPGERLAPAILRENGYHTCLISSHACFTAETRLGRAFDYVAPPTCGPFEALNAAILKALDARPRDKPFLVYVHAMDTHFPHDPSVPYDRWLPEGIESATPPYSLREQAYLRGLYDGSLAYADAQIGILMDALELRGLLESTIVIVGSDHGEMLGEDGNTCQHKPVACSEMLLVPLIMSGPRLPEGMRVSAVTENVDLVPTLIDLLGLQTDAEPDGKSLLRLLVPSGGAPAREYWFRWAHHISLPLQKFFVFHAGFVYVTGLGSRALYAWPCHLGERQDVAADHPELIARIEKYIQDEIHPRVRAFHERPRTTPAVFYAPVPGHGDPPDALVPPEAESANDNKWTLSDGRLFAEAGERVPSLTVQFPVPNGSYDVLMEIGSGSPASAVSCRAQGQTNWSIYAALDQER